MIVATFGNGDLSAVLTRCESLVGGEDPTWVLSLWDSARDDRLDISYTVESDACRAFAAWVSAYETGPHWHAAALDDLRSAGAARFMP